MSSSSLTGYGCKRPKPNPNRPDPNYPKVNTLYGNSFEMEYEAVFEYSKNDSVNNKPESDEEGTSAKKQRVTETFFGRMYHNTDLQRNVVDTVRKVAGFPTRVRTIRDISATGEVNYDIHEEKQCQSFAMRKNHAIDFEDIQDLFVNYPQFFHADDKYEYIGEYLVQNVSCHVFEMEISDFNKPIEGQDEDRENADYLHFIRKNWNGVVSDHATVTHWYPLADNHWSDSEFNHALSVPLKIEIRLFDDGKRANEIAKLTINVAAFTSETYSFHLHELLDLSVCEERPEDQIRFRMKFAETSAVIEKTRMYKKQIERAFRETMWSTNISPIR